MESSSDSIWIVRGKERLGPYSVAQLRQWLSEGAISLETLAWRKGLPTWTRLGDVLETEVVAPAFVAPEPAPAPVPAPMPAPVPVAAPAAQAAASGAYGWTDPDPYDPRRDLPAPPNLHWFVVVLLSLVTLSIFGIVWRFVQARWVKRIDPASNATLLLVAYLACIVVGTSLNLTAAHNAKPTLHSLGQLLSFAGWALVLTASFSMAGSIRRDSAARGVPLQIGGVTLFFFTELYLQSQMSWLARWKETGNTSPAPAKGTLYLLWLLFFPLVIVAAIAIPAYQGYLIRAQVHSAEILIERARAAETNYHDRTGHWPSDNGAAGLAAPEELSSPYVSSVTISDGQIEADFTVTAATQLRGSNLVLTPYTTEQGQVRWRCESSLPNKNYLPTFCR